MIVSRMIFELRIVEGYTQKDRRRIEKSVSTILKNRFNLSVVISRNDYPVNLFTINISQINSRLSVLENTYEKVLQYILDLNEIEMIKAEFEILN